jgi:hypothetical protein
MIVKVHEDSVYYTIAWSAVYPFDKYSASRIIPELSGLLYFTRQWDDRDRRPIFIYGCWRDGLRMGFKLLFDPMFSKHPGIAHALMEGPLFFKFTVVDTTPKDLKDVMSKLISGYRPDFNHADFPSSSRYGAVFVKETKMREGDVSGRVRF